MKTLKEIAEREAEKLYPFLEERGMVEQLQNVSLEECRQAYIAGRLKSPDLEEFKRAVEKEAEKRYPYQEQGKPFVGEGVDWMNDSIKDERKACIDGALWAFEYITKTSNNK